MKSLRENTVIVVVGDTHVPDRVDRLHPALLESIKNIRPEKILHTGDISQEWVLEELARIAPVQVVRGNRDWHWQKPLPMEIELKVNGVELILLHGHGGWGHYLVDKFQHTLRGYRLDRYRKYFVSRFPDADAYIFGHSHSPEKSILEGKLYFNPGSACLGCRPAISPSFGVLTISETGRMQGRIIPLQGYRLEAGHWAKVNL